MLKRAIIYKTDHGHEPYTEYVDSLKDRRGAAKIRLRVTRAELGNFGDHKKISKGIIELRIDHGPGYRVYIGQHGQELIVLLCAGDKSSQDADIKAALKSWEEFKKAL